MKTYKISPFRCRINQNGLTNVIEIITWEVTQPTTVNGAVYDLTVKGTTKLPDADPNSFTNTDELTKDQVINWIETYSDVDGLLAKMAIVKQHQLTQTYINIKPNFE